MADRSAAKRMIDAGRDMIVGGYFSASYRALATPAGRKFLRAAATPDAPAVHGYSTAEDITALIDDLQPSRDDLLVDLGCGFGEVAIAVHRRTGCRVLGIDASPRAVAEAHRRADAAGVSGVVSFEVGHLGPTQVRGSAAYALDSLMFVRRVPDVLASAARSLEPPGRVFVTFVDHRGLDRDSFERYITGPGLRLERLDDVTGQLAERSRRRSSAARRVLLARPPRAGRMGLLLVVVEEAIVTRLIERRRLRRWRFTAVREESLSGDDSAGPRSR